MIFSSLPTLASTTLPVSAFFWGWAVKNSLKLSKIVGEEEARGKKSKLPAFDLGVYSFFTSALSSSFLLGAGDGELSTLSRVAVTGSFVFVCINYCLGTALLSKMKGKGKTAAYCGVFSVLWGVLAYDVNTLMRA